MNKLDLEKVKARAELMRRLTLALGAGKALSEAETAMLDNFVGFVAPALIAEVERLQGVVEDVKAARRTKVTYAKKTRRRAESAEARVARLEGALREMVGAATDPISFNRLLETRERARQTLSEQPLDTPTGAP